MARQRRLQNQDAHRNNQSKGATVKASDLPTNRQKRHIRDAKISARGRAGRLCQMTQLFLALHERPGLTSTESCIRRALQRHMLLDPPHAMRNVYIGLEVHQDFSRT